MFVIFYGIKNDSDITAYIERMEKPVQNKTVWEADVLVAFCSL